ncbi:hypothetical protein MKX01_034121 [Papaver californicum]|nr:hypothetical protein MKX01_034121 [Papaver californicum]
MVFLSPLGLGAQVIGRRRRRKLLHSCRVSRPNEVIITPTSRFQLKPHGQKRKKKLEVEIQEKKSRCFQFNDNQEDVLAREILSWIPVKSLVRFKSVCKYWFSLIQEDMTFINLHLECSRERPCLLVANLIDNHTRYQLITSNLVFEDRDKGAISAASFHTIREVDFTDCDLMLRPVFGLTAFFGERRNDPGVCICNFITREMCAKKTLKLLNHIPMTTCTLGYDPTSKEHKVVGIWRYSQPSYVVCEVLTVGDNEWRKIDEVPPYIGEKEKKFIVEFDVGNEKFRAIRVPNYIFENSHHSLLYFYNIMLLELDGRLGLLIILVEIGYSCPPKLWVLDEDRNKIGYSIVYFVLKQIPTS